MRQLTTVEEIVQAHRDGISPVCANLNSAGFQILFGIFPENTSLTASAVVMKDPAKQTIVLSESDGTIETNHFVTAVKKLLQKNEEFYTQTVRRDDPNAVAYHWR